MGIQLVKTLDLIHTVLMPIVFVVFATAWIYCLVSIIRRRNSYKWIVSGAIGMLSIILIMTVGDFVTHYARRDVLRFLDRKNGPFTLDVQGQAVAEEQSDSLVSVLRTVRPYTGPLHSHPTDRVVIQVADHSGRAIHLALGRTSGMSQQYAVFLTDYRTTSNNELGRVVTSLLDSY